MKRKFARLASAKLGIALVLGAVLLLQQQLLLQGSLHRLAFALTEMAGVGGVGQARQNADLGRSGPAKLGEFALPVKGDRRIGR